MRGRDLRLVGPALAAWAAAGVAIGAPDAGRATAVAVAWGSAGLLVAAAFVLRERPHGGGVPGIALAAVVVAVVLSAVAAGAERRDVPRLAEAAAHDGSLTLDVEITGHVREGRAPGTAGGAPVLVFAEPDDAVLADSGIGDVIRVVGGVRRAEAGDEVAFLVFAREPVAQREAAGGVLRVAGEMRGRFAHVASGLPPPANGLLPGLAIGDTSALSPQLEQQMTVASLTHLTAVSGSNCAVVVAVVFVLAAAAGVGRRARVVAAGAAVVGFVVLVTPEPSVLRASVMAGIALVALASSRPGRGIPLLCLAIVVLLVADPWLARSYGFALSVLATAGLLVLTTPLAARLERWLPRWLALLVAVPVAAQLACQPVLLLLDPALPLYGVVANLLAEPAAPLATVGGLAACLLASVAPPLAPPVAALAWLPAAWIAAVAAFTAQLPGARSPWPAGPVGVLLLTLLTAAAIAVILARDGSRMRRAAAALLVVAIVAYPVAAAGGRLAVTLSRPGDWQIAQCDVGQGDAVVLRSGDRVALVDTGPEPEPLAACLADLGVGRIDLLVLTHYDLDHVGGVEAVVGRVDRALVGPAAGPEDAVVAERLATAGTRVEQAARGQRGVLGGWDWTVLWPPAQGAEPGNAASVALLLRPGPGCACLSALLLGDLGEESQQRMRGALPGGLPRVDVVKVAHHGSRDQSAALYEDAGAAVGLIGVGVENDYGHPTPALLGILAAAGTTPARSDLDGLVLLAPGAAPGDVRVWRERGG